MKMCTLVAYPGPLNFSKVMPKTMHLYSGGKSTTRGGGLLTYIHSDLYLITERHVPNVDMEYI